MSEIIASERRIFTAMLESDLWCLRHELRKFRESRGLPGARAYHRGNVRQAIIGVRHCCAQLEKLDAWEAV